MKHLPMDCCVCLRRIDAGLGHFSIPHAPGSRVCSWMCRDRFLENFERDFNGTAQAVAVLTATVSDQRSLAERALAAIEYSPFSDAMIRNRVKDILQEIAFPPAMTPPRPTTAAGKGGAR